MAEKHLNIFNIGAIYLVLPELHPGFLFSVLISILTFPFPL
jgi:hypothetical protein